VIYAFSLGDSEVRPSTLIRFPSKLARVVQRDARVFARERKRERERESTGPAILSSFSSSSSTVSSWRDNFCLFVQSTRDIVGGSMLWPLLRALVHSGQS
jgi:hypothetical protein